MGKNKQPETTAKLEEPAGAGGKLLAKMAAIRAVIRQKEAEIEDLRERLNELDKILYKKQ